MLCFILKLSDCLTFLLRFLNHCGMHILYHKEIYLLKEETSTKQGASHMPLSKVLLTIEQWEMLKWKAEVLIATHTISPHVLIPCYCWSAFWGYVSKRNCLEKHFCCYSYCCSSDILALGCDHRNLQVLSVTMALNETLLIYL